LSETVREITPIIKLLNPHIGIPGYDSYIATYLILGEKKAVIDIGPRIGVSGRLKSLKEAGFGPEGIDYLILTHVHIDHAGGTGTALKTLKNARVIVHSRGRLHLINPDVLWKASLESSRELSLKYGQYEPVAEDRIIAAEDGMKLDLGKGIVLEFIMTPGHASHHMSIYEHSSKVIFTGDSAGLYTSRVLRLTAPPPFYPIDYLNSIDRMIAMHPQLLAYAHFGCYPDAVARLKLIKEKVRSWLDIAREGAKARKTPEQVAHDIIEEDPELGYFKTLNQDEFARDNHQFVLTVSGLMTAK
jgi:glyoxylase-like metal-dependent hydrolase (beta-lactamase superfamily II)